MILKDLTRRWLSLLLLLLLSLGTCMAAQQRKGASEQKPEDVIVYVTRTGAKYHRDGCQYLRRSKIPMKLKEAKERYTPCSKCRPPQ